MRLTQRESSSESITWFFGVLDVRTPFRPSQLDVAVMGLIWIAPAVLIAIIYLVMNAGDPRPQHAPQTCGAPSAAALQRAGVPLGQ